MTSNTNPAIAAIVAALAPVIAAAVVLFKLNLTPDQQGEIVLGLAAILTAAGTVYASVHVHAAAKVKVAQATQGYPAVDGDNSQATRP